VATFNLNHEQAEALAARLATALQQDSQNPAEVLPPYPSKKKLPKGWVYMDEEVEAEVKAEVTDLSKYCRVHPLPSLDLPSPANPLTAPTSAQETCTWPAKLGHKVMKRTLEDNMFPSASLASMAKKPRHASSKST
jgi:hypothetical protein